MGAIDAINSFARQAMMAFGWHEVRSDTTAKNVAIQLDESRNEIPRVRPRSASDFSMFNPRFHVTLRILTARLRQGEDEDGEGVHISDGTVIDSLGPLPEVYAGLDFVVQFLHRWLRHLQPQRSLRRFRWRAGGGVFLGGTQGEQGFSEGLADPRGDTNGMTGSGRIYAWRGDAWR